MTRQATWVALAMFGGAVIGCGPAKELPNAGDIPTAPGSGDKAPTAPTASDPAAKEYVETARKAFGGGNADLVAKGALSRATLKGTMALPINNETIPLPTTRTIAAGWSDRFFAGNVIDFRGQTMNVRVWLRGGQLTTHEGDTEHDRGNRAELTRATRADGVGQHWMALLLPLSDPKAVVYELKSADVPPPTGGPPQPTRQLKLALPELPVYHLAFDAKTNLLVRVEYVLFEQGGQSRRQWWVLEHKPGPDGRVLPTKTECRHNGGLVEKWDVEKWEFPASVDADFAPPKR